MDKHFKAQQQYYISQSFLYVNERKSEEANIPHAPTLLENAVYNEWHFQALVRGNRTENQFHISCTK